MSQTEWLGILCIRNMVFVTLQIFFKINIKKNRMHFWMHNQEMDNES